MQTIKFEIGSIGRPFSDDYVMEVESEIGIKFPLAYIDFMKHANGGKPIKQFFSIGSNEKVIERFLSFVEDYKNDELGLYDIEVVWSQIEDRLEEGVCPFAALFAGDFLCFDFQKGGVPSIVLWNHDAAARGNPCYQHVANSFDEFLTSLKAAEISA
ncbi:SMI1/KNR4 family protein [Undibacterium pigrum]|uniref:SUKH superfamily protein n=1 Tax=Undibacterium pigrum TaxID=401470 RepID=A0A318JE57_9BURK|nr:SMI1/KNR4 family protein [Undibacterium pigrum]PXX46787.1 SUKH superfamily protein [Undibacterium pigrum]